MGVKNIDFYNNTQKFKTEINFNNTALLKIQCVNKLYIPIKN